MSKPELAHRDKLTAVSNSTPIPMTWDDAMAVIVKHIPVPRYSPDQEADNFLFVGFPGARGGVWYNRHKRAAIANMKEAVNWRLG